jgi:Tfp pilus assembly protein PilF
MIYEDEGWIHQFEDENNAAAEVAYRKSIALGGNEPLKNFASVLYKQGKYREALEPLAEALTKDPADPGLHFTRALIYMKIGMVREGLAETQMAAIAGYADAQNNLGAYYMTGIAGVLQPDPRAGVDWFRKAVAQDETHRPNLEAALAAHPELSQPADAPQISAH